MIEELLIALNGCPGDIFHPPRQIDLTDANGNLDGGDRDGWIVAAELRQYLHPGEHELLSKLLILASWIAKMDEFVQKFSVDALFLRAARAIDAISAGDGGGDESGAANFDRAMDLFTMDGLIDRSTTTPGGENRSSSIRGIYATSLTIGFETILGEYRSRLIDLERALCNHDGRPEIEFVRPTNCLQTIFAELQPYYRIAPVLNEIAAAFDGPHAIGDGELLAFLGRLRRTNSGDTLIKSMIESLIRRCLAPLRDDLIRWLTSGHLDTDRPDDFFIRRSETVAGEFVVEKVNLPLFISESTAEKIRFIGKSVVAMLAMMTTAEIDEPIEPIIDDETGKFNSSTFLASESFELSGPMGADETTMSTRPQEESNLDNIEPPAEDLDDWETVIEPLSEFLWSIDREVPIEAAATTDRLDDLARELDKHVERIRQAASEKLFTICFQDMKAEAILGSWIRNGFLIGKESLFVAFIDQLQSTASSLDHQKEVKYILANCWSTAKYDAYWLSDQERSYFEKLSPYLDAAMLEEGKQFDWNAIRLRLETPEKLRAIFTPEFTDDLNKLFSFLLRWRRTQSLVESCWYQLKKAPSKITRTIPALEKIQKVISLMLFMVQNLQYYIRVDVLEVDFAGIVRRAVDCRDFQRFLQLLHVELMEKLFAHCFLDRAAANTGAGGVGSWHAKVGKILKSFGDDCDAFCSMVMEKLRAAEDGAGTFGDDSTSSSSMESDRVSVAKTQECYVSCKRKTTLLAKMFTSAKGQDKDNECLKRLLLRLDFNHYFSSTTVYTA